MKTRLQYIVNNEGLSNNRFATEIGVSPAAVTHIVSGRNNPSLEIIAKIASRYPKYSLRWLVLGELPILSEEPSEIHSNLNNVALESNLPQALPASEPSLFSFETPSEVDEPKVCQNKQESTAVAPESDSSTLISNHSTQTIDSQATPTNTNPERPSNNDRLIVCLPDGTFQEYRRRQ